MGRNHRNKRKIQNKNIYSQSYLKILTLITLIVIFSLIGFILFNTLKNNNKFQKSFQIATSEDISTQNSLEDTLNTQENSNLEKANSTFTLTAIGDVMCHNTQYWDAYNKETDDYDFSYVFDEISLYTKKSDLTIGSLETSFAGKERGYSNYPTFNTPDDLAYNLKKIGVNVLSTAGNHCLDMGFTGLSRTIDILDKADISHLGTYKTQEERDTILIKYVKGVKIAFINYTYGTNGIPVPNDKPYCVNLIDKELIQKDIESAKNQNADMIIACMHWGTEYRTTANEEQQQLADFLFENGVDVILGNHPHVLEPMEKRTVTLSDGTTKYGFVIYALGNFICDQNAENTRNSIILNLTITKHTDGKISIDKVDYIPIYMYKNTSAISRKMKLLDIEKTISAYENGTDVSIGEKNYNYLKTQLEKIKSIVGEEI